MGTDIVLSDLNRRVGEDDRLSGLDKQLLDMANKRFTGEQMEAELGGRVSAARCIQRVREILKSQNYLDTVERQSLLLLDLVELKDILFQRVRDEGGITTDRHGNDYWTLGDPRWSANLIRLLKEFRAMIETSAGEIEKNANTIRSAHRDIMYNAMELTFERFVFDLEKQFDIPKSVLMEMFEKAIPVGFAALNERVAADD